MRPNSPSRRTSTMCARRVADLKIAYPVAIDNDYAIWRAFDNQYWPAHYFIDAEGRIRHHHFGEGDYDGVGAGDPAAPGRGRQDRRAGRSLVAVERDGCGSAPRTWRMSDRRKPMSAMTGPRISSRPAARCRTRPMSMRRQRPGSTNGGSPATGRSAASMPRSTQQGRQHRLPLPCPRPASRARPGAGRQAGALPRDDRRRGARATAMAPMSTPTARAS